MMELLWTPEAIQDRDDIYDYLEADNPAAALALDELSSEKIPSVSSKSGRWWVLVNAGDKLRESKLPAGILEASTSTP